MKNALPPALLIILLPLACGRDAKAPTGVAAPALSREAGKALGDLERALDGAVGPVKDATRGTSSKRGAYHATTTYEVVDASGCDLAFDEIVSETLTDAEAKVRPSTTRITRKIALGAIDAASIGVEADAVVAIAGQMEARCTTTVGAETIACSIGTKPRLVVRVGAKANEVAAALRDAAAACRAGGAS